LNGKYREMGEDGGRDGEGLRDWNRLMHNCWSDKEEDIPIEKCCA
jgi:hypothetical protein